MYQRVKKLVSPMMAKKLYDASALTAKKEIFDAELRNIISGKGKFLLIVGPCSADNYDAVMAYCEQLKRIYERVAEKLFIVPRIYTTKPRSESGAYRGMLHSPDGETQDINKGILLARKLMKNVAENFGFFAADEMLYPELHSYFDDLLSYVTVGARSSESQLHRMAAGCLDVPVGIKNPMHGNLKSVAQAIDIANKPSRFALGGYEIVSEGNPYAHAILRGYADDKGNMHQNYSQEFIDRFIDECSALGVCPAVVVDCNHFNSGKNYLSEPDIALSVVDSLSKGQNNVIKGLMIESYLYDGRQDSAIRHGVSLTDGCLGIEKTEKLIYDIAERL